MSGLEQSVHSLTVEHQQLMAWTSKFFEMMSTRNRRQEGENSHGRPRAGDGEDFPTGDMPHNFNHRHVKLDFPPFNGEEDQTNWICRAKQLFRFQGTNEEDKAALASFHLKGKSPTLVLNSTM